MPGINQAITTAERMVLAPAQRMVLLHARESSKQEQSPNKIHCNTQSMLTF
jgi:hypothetical protein